MSDNIEATETLDTGSNEAGKIESQVEEQKMFTQEQLNDIVAKRVAQMKNKYSEVDASELTELRKFKESIEEEQLMNRQDFESVLKKHKEKSSDEINTLRAELTKIKVDGALIQAASKAKAVAPEQVAKLLKDSIQMQSDGNVVVVDQDGKPRYTDAAEPFTVDGLVEEFLASNSYFRAAGPAGTGSQSNKTEQSLSTEVDIGSLDMNLPEHRAIYKEMKAKGKI